jgi:eukaryotic-like serine/threonine-protein kinase
MNDPADSEVAVFGAALQLPAWKRAAYLDATCAGDDDLRQRVEAFLAAHMEAGAFLEGPARGVERALADKGAPNQDESPRLTSAPAEKAGDRVGRYKLLQLIGEGGCGVVYMAEQEEPVHRRVALKVIKLGMDTKRVVARFEAERQALALMDHPNIAKVLDAGATDTGRLFFVMELIRGVKITDYCDQNQLLTRERLDLFVRVCQAIQHAHQKGVIHRDIKPSNVLVTVNDGVPVPKVIDFGIAKATQGRLTDRTLFTAFEQFIGTPAYMSPEQAVMTSLDIDTRSDIYSLGVLLYELLTGTTPFDGQELLQAGLDEMRRTIREEEPVRPSTRLSTMQDADLTAAASRRNTEAPRLIHTLRGDLDWIVMKALEKDRARRYETANGLARDVERYLVDEPILARPPSKLYGFSKLVRRNKLACIAAVVVTSSLILGLGAVTMAALRVQRDNRQIRKTENDALEKLRASYLAEARAERHSGRAGQRVASLEAVRNAAAIRPDLDARDEAIACLALSDVSAASTAAFHSSNLDAQACFDANLEKYAIEDGPGNITIRAAVDDREIMLLPGFGLGVTLIGGFSPDGRFLAVVYSDDTVRVWDLTTQKPALQGLFGSGVFSADSRVFALSTPDGDLVFYGLGAGRQIRRLHVKARLGLLGFDSTGTRLICNRWKEAVLEIRAVENGRVISTCLPAANPCSAAWSPDGKFVATGCSDGQVFVWDAESGQKLVTLDGHTETVVSVAFNHAGDLLATASWDDRMLLWNPVTGRPVVGFLGWTYGLHFSPNDERLAAFQNGSEFGLLSVTRSAEYRRLSSVHSGQEHSGPEFSHDGRLIAAGTGDRICFWDTLSGKEVAFFPARWCDAVLFPGDGQSFITSDRTGLYSRSFLRLPGSVGSAYKLGPARRLYTAPDPREATLSLDGRHLALVANHIEGQSLILDLQDPAKTITLGNHPLADYIAISPDGRWAATSSYQNSVVKVWDARSGELVRDLSMPARSRVGFSPDGHWLVAMSTEYEFWEVGSWQRKTAPIPGHPAAHLNSLAFSPDNTVIALVQDGRNIELLEAMTGRSLARLEAPDGGHIVGLRFSPDGSQLAALEQNRQLQLWDLRLVRQALKQTKLDWVLPPYPQRDVSRTSGDATLDIEPEAGPGPFATPELARTIPVRDPQAGTNLIDLSPWYNSALIPAGDLNIVDLFDLPRGIQNLAGVSFDVRGLIQVGEPSSTGLKYPMKVSGIVLGRSCRRLHFLHGAVSVSGAPKGTRVGSYVIHYVNDRSVEIPILESELLVDATTAAPQKNELSTFAWRSQPSEAHRTAARFCLIRTTWENPFPADPIASLDFLANPPGTAPYLVAITADP